MDDFPNADQVATAIVEAARLTGENPQLCALARGGLRCRAIAMEALCLAFPTARRPGLARCVGYPKAAAFHGWLASAKRASWWREEWVDEVVGALIGEDVAA